MSTEHMFYTWTQNLLERLYTHGSVNADPSIIAIFSNQYWYAHDAFVRSLNEMIVITPAKIWLAYMFNYIIKFIPPQNIKLERVVLPGIINRWDIRTSSVYCEMIDRVVDEYMLIMNKGYTEYINFYLYQINLMQ
jgi:hypothetical protein